MPTVAVVGASSDPSKFGNKCVRAYRRAGWEVVPVNPREREIEGFTVSATLAEVAAPLDRIAMYLPPPLTRKLLPELAAKGAEVYLNPGTWDADVVAEADRLGVQYRTACAIVAIGMSPSQFP